MKGARLQVIRVLAGVCGVAAIFSVGCANEQEKKGHELYTYYCSDCHGESGKQNEGFNWAAMPEPKPKDLSNAGEMGTFTDQELFETISRDMLNTNEEEGDEIGDDDFAVPTMPTFKYTLSEDEIWAIVAHVRSLHGKKMEFDVLARKTSLEEGLKTAQAQFEVASKAFEEAETKANEEAEKKAEKLGDDADVEVDESLYANEQAALGKAKAELDAAQVALNNFTSRPGKGVSITRPDLTTPPAQMEKLVTRGKQLYEDKYGCNGCHSLEGEGGKIGPALDRAGFRLNATWVYRWLKNPQAMDAHTRMPALGLSDEDAKAVTLYVDTLRAEPTEPNPETEKPVEMP